MKTGGSLIVCILLLISFICAVVLGFAAAGRSGSELSSSEVVTAIPAAAPSLFADGKIVTVSHDGHRWVVFCSAHGLFAIHHPDCQHRQQAEVAAAEGS